MFKKPKNKSASAAPKPSLSRSAASPQKPKKADKSKPIKRSANGLYSNLAYRHNKKAVKADLRARKKAEDLASLPKSPIPRFFAKLHPKRVFHYWFSKEGFFRFLKILAFLLLIGIILVGGLFLYFKKDLDKIRPEELAARVSNSVNTYLDRNGVVLWEDKGDGDYRLIAEADEISTYMRQATVAIEDRNFYNHPGVDIKGLTRAVYLTFTGQAVQGGSTLTQQLIKQVYFMDEATSVDRGGIARKIKELILSLEVEKMYDKEQIITMYMNESSYGGRRNGVEAGAQAYFGKSAKDLTLAESALLAAIPNNPSVLNPYNTAGNKRLLERQRYTLDVMAELGYITAEEAEAAKAEEILATILPEQNQYENIKAPHFVLEVKRQLEEKFGMKTIRAGGYTITTTLDYRIQEVAEAAVAKGTEYFYTNAADNIALSSVDVETAQVIAMVGSAGWNIPEYGQTNATLTLLEPASTIKPILDYAPLFVQREGQNWGPGSILRDENIDSIYCAGNVGKCSLNNASRQTYGDVTIRQALAGSLNRPAVKALYINGAEKSLEVAHALGDVSYCADQNIYLSAAIGGGCGVRQIEHANAYASLARGGVYKPASYYLEVKNSSDEIIDQWIDVEGEQAVDEQVAYMVTDILKDADARRFVFGSMSSGVGFNVPGVLTAAKTGTTENGSGSAKDSWLMSYSTSLSTGVWTGKHDGKPLKSDSHTVAFQVGGTFMENAHKILIEDGSYEKNRDFTRPAGIQELTVNGKTDVWPSWYSKNTSGISKETLVFDSITKKLATECTPPETRVEVEVSKMIDPMTKNEIWLTGEYNKDEPDDLHQCSDIRPRVLSVTTTQIGGSSTETSSETNTPAENANNTPAAKSYRIVISLERGTFDMSGYEISLDGEVVASGAVSGATLSIDTQKDFQKVKVTITDTAGYVTSVSANKT
jgi:penicillin-binding protein 1A